MAAITYKSLSKYLNVVSIPARTLVRPHIRRRGPQRRLVRRLEDQARERLPERAVIPAVPSLLLAL